MKNAKYLRKLVGLPEEFEPDPEALKKLDGCLSDLVAEGENVDSVELVRQIRRRNWETDDC